jgi:hypothetical protein
VETGAAGVEAAGAVVVVAATEVEARAVGTPTCAVLTVLATTGFVPLPVAFVSAGASGAVLGTGVVSVVVAVVVGFVACMTSPPEDDDGVVAGVRILITAAVPPPPKRTTRPKTASAGTSALRFFSGA